MDKNEKLVEKFQTWLETLLGKSEGEAEKANLEESETKDVKLEQWELVDGVIIEAESFEAGMPVVVITEDGAIPLQPGDYPTKDNGIVVVVEEGVIAEIKPMEEEVEQEAEVVSVEAFNELVAKVDALTSTLSKEKEELSKSEEANTELEKLNTDLQKELDEKPDAVELKHIDKKVTFEPKNKKERLLAMLRQN